MSSLSYLYFNKEQRRLLQNILNTALYNYCIIVLCGSTHIRLPGTAPYMYKNTEKYLHFIISITGEREKRFSVFLLYMLVQYFPGNSVIQ